MALEHIDAYVHARMHSLRQRSTKKSVAVHLRSFLRYLHSSGRIPDLSSAVLIPKLYVHEGIPSALQPEQIAQVLRSTRKDRSPMGLRDYAILTLLSTYGLRAGEIAALCLEDIDWTHDRLRIRHSKTGVHSELPLLRAPGEAILDYLRKGRPKTTRREVFLRACAPYRALRGGSLHSVLEPRLKAAGVVPRGKRGPHAFRHAKAASLLRSAVPLKVIGDVFAHRSASFDDGLLEAGCGTATRYRIRNPRISAMRALPAAEEDCVRRFVDSLGLGDRDAASVYREVARHLLRFVSQRYGRMESQERHSWRG